jgi:hypothetical protein
METARIGFIFFVILTLNLVPIVATQCAQRKVVARFPS